MASTTLSHRFTRRQRLQKVLEKNYTKEEQRWYEALAKYEAARLDSALDKWNDNRPVDEERFQARVTHRGKTYKSLRDSVIINPYGGTFTDWESIRSFHRDLAGIRLIMYVPGQTSRVKADRLIKSVWPAATETRTWGKKNPQQSEDYETIHLGYQAVHYNIKMSAEELQQSGFQYPPEPQLEDNSDEPRDEPEVEPGSQPGAQPRARLEVQFEIQVVSALAHGLAEPQHDIVFKTAEYGKPSRAERRILDAVSGILLSADVLLEQFNELYFGRIYKRFGSIDELGACLRTMDASFENVEDVEVNTDARAVDLRTTNPHAVEFYVDIEEAEFPLFPPPCQEYLLALLSGYNMDFPKAMRDRLLKLGFPETQALDVIEQSLGKQIREELDFEWRGYVCLADSIESTNSEQVKNNVPAETQRVAIVSTLLLLQYIFTPGLPEHLAQSLKNSRNGKALRDSLVWVLSNLRYFDEFQIEHFGKHIDREEKTRHGEEYRHHSLPTFTWLQELAKSYNVEERTIYGLAFRLALRGALPRLSAKNLEGSISVLRTKLQDLSLY